MDTTTAPDIEGRSKRVWRDSDDTCVVELIPSLRSFTYGRDELIESTGPLRLDFYERAAARLAAAGLRTAFLERIGPIRYRARYRPAPPFEVIVKNRAVGSTTIKYPGLFEAGCRLPRPVVKFDYRVDPEDQPIGEDYLRALGVPVDAFRDTAFAVNAELRAWLDPLDLWDFCLILAVDTDGAPIVISEVSPDCMRLRHPDGTKLDKDLFRDGGSPDEITAAWRRLLDELR
ncbi:phosphoribosylaminoimidazolesuccinocarboxamide synthase [Amorphoplanes nipponensis]|uniref:Phosphoribosylaminoimidazole-succinocarboxamide synthase n=1 Tax=Actinoplanes nipponensis TaxID=135950 RepID=A0A919JB30_9ACTN|nr:phosphoribosylaminoimidazolesuccinocarboxamide synthase [Actinoplanes nipponensis]GIE47066.1 phosphoribosylaminoimidazole-succinocarboxamide synthase [Actinoplanes nipponensis]